MKGVGHEVVINMLKRFQSKAEYTALKKACKAAVAEWRWATSQMLPEIPHGEIVSGFKPPKWVKKQTRHGFLHGLDKDGRIRCIRSDELTKPDNTVYEQFLIHEPEGFWCTYFNADSNKAALAVKWFEMNGERWLRSLELGGYGFRERVLRWEDDRFTGYTDRSWSGVTARDVQTASASNFTEEHPTVYAYSYATDGELDRVTAESIWDENAPPLVEVKYQRIPKGADLKSLLQQAEDMLVAEIPKAIKAAKVRETVYGLLVQFTGVDTDPSGFAPPLFLGTESLRERTVAQHPKDYGWRLWAVPEWESDPGCVRVAYKNAELDEKLHLIFQLTVVQASPTNYGPVRKMFQRVCARLNALNWKGILKTTDDFVVIPFDTHGELDLKADMRACVPVEKLRLLMDRGFIGRMKLK
jgi:hypothetical protein